MKLIRMKIRRTQGGGATHYDYPTPHYDPQKVVYGPIYEGGLDEVVQSNIVPRGNIDEYILIGVADGDLIQFMKAEGYVYGGFTYGAVEVDKIAALVDGNKWTGPQVNKITDPNKVIEVLAKIARKETLTIEEEDAINPDKRDVKGIVKTKSFEEGLDEAIAAN